MIKVLHLQKHLPSSGNAAYRLHTAMLKNGIDSKMLSLTSEILEGNVVENLDRKASAIALINEKCEHFITKHSDPKFGLFSFPLFGNDISSHEMVLQAEVIYIHWAIGGFLNFNSIRKIASLNKPVIFFMHDMWTLTGGCHHSFDCVKYKVHCNNCPMFPGEKIKDVSYKGFRKKNSTFSKFNNLYFIAPSKWLFNCASESNLLKNKPTYYIPNILDTSTFKPFEKKVAREILNIDSDAKVMAFGASSINNPYKGWSYLKESLQLLFNQTQIKNIIVIIFGEGNKEQIKNDIKFPIKFVGKLKDDYSLALIYNAADVFIAPSVADNLPTTIMESLACATPVIAFNVGGIPDMVIHKKNGYLAKYKDSKDLAAGIEECLKTEVKGFLPEDLSTDKTILKHLELFKNLLIPQQTESCRK